MMFYEVGPNHSSAFSWQDVSMAGMMGQNLQLLRIQGDQGDQVPGGAPDISTKIQVF